MISAPTVGNRNFRLRSGWFYVVRWVIRPHALHPNILYMLTLNEGCYHNMCPSQPHFFEKFFSSLRFNPRKWVYNL